jgi:4-amino-4-deoxy-L-arabinose transferase-like glycosyltransferase
MELVAEAPSAVVAEVATIGADHTAATRALQIDWGGALRGRLGVALAAFVVGVAACVFSSSHGLMFLYADARSHLTIARRLIDGQNHGIVQLGTVWLPLPHLLLTPFVAFRALWHNGWAAAPVGIIALMVEAVSVFAIVVRLVRSRLAGGVAVILLLSNPSILYMHTTALTEPVLFAAMLLTVATLVRWATSAKVYSGGEIAVFCGLPAAATVLGRYDGWAFVFAAAAVVFVVAWQRWGSLRYALRVTRSFAVLPAIAALWWMWFNWINFGDPLEFQRGRYSAQAQQALLESEGRLPDKGDLVRSVDTYSSSVLRASGWLLLALAAVGGAVWIVRHVRQRHRSELLVPWLLVLVPFGFYVLSLFTGQVALRLKTTADDSMFNLRYGVEMLLGLVVFAGIAVDAIRVWIRQRVGSDPRRLRLTLLSTGWVVLAALVVGQSSSWGGWRNVGVVKEGFAQRAAGVGQYAAAEWMHDNALDGIILIDDSINPMLPVIDADLDRVAAPFSGNRWDNALVDPSTVDWVYIDTANPFDEVGTAARTDRFFAAQFELRFSSGNAEVYQRRTNVSPGEDRS